MIGQAVSHPGSGRHIFIRDIYHLFNLIHRKTNFRLVKMNNDNTGVGIILHLLYAKEQANIDQWNAAVMQVNYFLRSNRYFCNGLYAYNL